MNIYGFLKGFSSVLDLLPNQNEEQVFIPMPDVEAFASDLKIIGGDMNCLIHILNQ